MRIHEQSPKNNVAFIQNLFISGNHLGNISMENSKKEKNGKTGIVPNEEIKGSDADKAYDENGNFGTADLVENDPEKSDVPPKTDADS